MTESSIHCRLASFRDNRARVLGLAIVFMLGLCALAVAGCSASSSQAEEEAAAPATSHNLSAEQCEAGAEIQAASQTTTDGYLIQPGDQLDLSFYLNPEFDQAVTVRPDGKISVKLVGEVQAARLTPDRLAKLLDTAYQRELRSPGCSVHVKGMAGRVVYVQGEVTKPGAVPLEVGMTALQAIAQSGGLTPEANTRALLIRRDACGMPQGMKLNLAQAMKSPDKGEDAVLIPRDVIVVPKSTIASLDQFMDQWIRKMIPVSPYIPIPF
jgi:protein involved in polysaccharide export with SLBB domain